MNWKKGVICLIAAVFLLAACNSKNNGNGGGDNTPTPNQGDTPEPISQETKTMEFDLGGKTIKVVSWWDMSIPEDNPDNIQKKRNLEELMEKHNFKIEYIAIDYGEYQNKVVSSLLAGEPLGDIVRLGKTYTVPNLVKHDLLWPIDEYTKNAKVFNQLVTQEYSYKGRGYGFSEDHANLVNGIFYNRTLMNELGLKPLQEYVDEDNWNWDTFIKVAKEANQDRDNDGKIDTWGLASDSLMEFALASNNTGLTVEDRQNLDDPKVAEAFNFISRLAVEQVGRPSEGGDWTEPAQFFRQGNVLMLAGPLYNLEGIKNDMPDTDIGFVPFPKGPSATEYHSFEPLFQALTIPKSVPNPEQLMYIWEKIHDIDSIYDYPGQSFYESVFTTEADIENAKTVAANMLVLDHNTFPNLPFGSIVDDLRSGVSVSTVIEKYRQTVQAAIDEVYN
mgnify:CR=1 FL=1|jgi:ABC-type glycerol-3-phosphate transport system substrate-binding protein